MPHSFVNALVYDLPVGKGKAFGKSMPAVANALVGGWQVSGVVKLASGLPVFPVNWDEYSNPLGVYGFPGVERPNLVGNPKPSHQTPDNWINAAAFQRAPAYTYGNAPRYMDAIRESAARNVDLALAKTFQAEAFKVQFRADFLNLFNTPQFGGGNQWGSNIGQCLDCGGFGVVNGTTNLPRNIQLGLKVNFDD